MSRTCLSVDSNPLAVDRELGLTDLPPEILRRIMLFTMGTEDPRPNEDTKETFLNASDPSSLRNGIYLAFTCRRMLHVFQDSLTGVRLVSSWQTEQRTLIAACKIASNNLRAIHVECSAPVTGALREVVRLHPPIRHFVLIGVNISKVLMADIIYYVGHSLEKLVISAAPSLDDSVVELISMRCRSLKYLELGGSRRVNCESLMVLFANIGPSLRGIELNALQHESLDEQVLLCAADYCVSLAYFRLLKLRWVTDIGLEQFFKLRAHQLTEFRLEACRNASAHVLCVLGRYGTALEKLHCSFERGEWISAHQPPPSYMDAVAEPDLCETPLYLQESCLNVGEQALVHISRRCVNLWHLTLSDVTISDAAMEHLSRACGTSLRILNLRHCSSLGDRTLVSVAKHAPNLTSLDVSYLPLLRDEAFSVLLSALQSSLQELQIIGCKGLTDRTVQSILPRFGKRLKTVRLSYCNFSRHSVSILREALPRVTLCGTSNCVVQ